MNEASPNRYKLLVLVCLGLASCVSCGGGGDEEGTVGSPCNVDEDCRDGLECDFHGERGSCQEPHDHEDEND